MGKRRLQPLLLLLAIFSFQFNCIDNIEEEDNASIIIFSISGDDVVCDMCQAHDGEYIVVGKTEKNIDTDALMIKVSSNGNIRWSHTYGGEHWDVVRSVQRTSEGGYIIAGFTNSYGNGGTDVWLIKTDLKGNDIWKKTYGGSEGEYGVCVQQTTDRGFIITGWKSTDISVPSESYVLLIKTDENGEQTWSKILRTGVGYSVIQSSDAGYVVAAQGDFLEVDNNDILLIKTNSEGDTIWTKNFGGTEYETVSCLKKTTDGGYIIVGTTNSYGDPGGDVFLVKTDSEGNLLWNKIIGNSGETEEGQYVYQTGDSGYIIAADKLSYTTEDYDIFLIKTDSKGDTLWTRIYGEKNADHSSSVLQMNNSGYIIAGTSFYKPSPYQANARVMLIKTDRNGNIF
jgi:hypothetical protein